MLGDFCNSLDKCITEPIKCLRNRIMHIGKPVVSQQTPVAQLAATLEQIGSVRSSLSRLDENWRRETSQEQLGAE